MSTEHSSRSLHAHGIAVYGSTGGATDLSVPAYKLEAHGKEGRGE